MKLNKAWLFYFLFALFVLYGLNSVIFERVFFVNEILAFAGFACFAFQVLLQKEHGKIQVPKSEIFRWILLLHLLGIYHLIASIFLKTSWFYYLRNTVLFYAVFSFYIGFYGLPYFIKFIRSARYVMLAY